MVPISLLNSLGWAQQVLPDGSVYYVHSTLHVTTDINLRKQKNLYAVAAFVEQDEDLKQGRGNAQDLELWLRPGTASKGQQPKLEGRWVDHGSARIAGLDDGNEEESVLFELVSSMTLFNLLFLQAWTKNIVIGALWKLTRHIVPSLQTHEEKRWIS